MNFVHLKMWLLKIFTVLLITIPLVRPKIAGNEYASMPPVFHMEDYDTCMMLGEKSVYCYIQFQLEPIDSRNTTNTWNVIKQQSSSPLRYRHDYLRHFVCLTKICQNVKTTNTSNPKFRLELSKCYSQKFENSGLKGTVIGTICKTSRPVYKVDLFDSITQAAFCGYVLFIFIVSFIDLKQRYETSDKYKEFKETPWGWLVTSFSIPSNWSKLISIPKSGDFDKLKGIQGIRVYMTVLVIGVHTCLTFTALPVSNTNWLEELNESPDALSEFPKRGIFLLSFHFMVSSWILMNSLLIKHNRGEDISMSFILKSVIKRYVRFLPSVALVVGFYATWYRHIPFGPLWSGVCDESERCRQNWWTNILFIQNHVNRYYMCHIVSWYLAVEMQYYILSLFIIKFMMKRRNAIPLIITLLLVINMMLVYVDHYRHGYPSTLTGNPEELFQLTFNRKPQWHDHFASYHGNFSGTLVGMLFGYYFYKYKNVKLFTSKISIFTWWLLFLGLLSTVIYLPLVTNVDVTLQHSAVWVAVTRPIFSIGMGVLALGISHGLGGFIKWTFEWPPLQGLAKLSYCVYISHTVFQNIRVGLVRTPVFVNSYVFAITMASDVLVSFLAAVPLTLLFEMPANEIANSLFRVRSHEEKKD